MKASLTPTGDLLAMSPRSAQARLTMGTKRAPLDFRIFPSSTCAIPILHPYLGVDLLTCLG